MRCALALVLTWAAWGCCDAVPMTASKPDGGAKPVKLGVQIGTPDPATGLDFVPLEAGGDIPLDTFGQGGTHATLAIRCIGFGAKAFVEVGLDNLDEEDAGPGNSGHVMTVPSVRPQLLLCRDKAMTVCDLLPVHVMTGGLARPADKNGLHIRVTATVHTESGLQASGSQDGVLRQNF